MTLSHDPLGRLIRQTSGGVTTRFLYAGGMISAELDGANAWLRRYVPGPGMDEPIVWYEGAGTSDRRFLQADERGSIVAISNGAGATIAINSYDEYGNPAATNLGRFQYTGQAWLPESGLYYYKARIYSPSLGRFMQTDPIGYADGMNLYAYVGNDPVNKTDPWGLDDEPQPQEVVVTLKLSYHRFKEGGTHGPMSSAAWHVPEMCLSSGCFKELYTYIHNMVRRDEPNEPNKPKNEETAEERRKRLAEEDRKRRQRNAHCAAVRTNAMKTSAIDGLGLGALGIGVDLAHDKVRNFNLRNLVKGTVTRGFLVAGVVGMIKDGEEAVANDPVCSVN